jgi:hypothetical protein
MTAETLSRLLEGLLGGARHATVLENGARIVNLAESRYSVSGEYNKCLLHLGSAERNAVRRILHADLRNGSWRLMVQKLVAPTLPIHPATDTILRYLAPRIDWTLMGVDEPWRDGVRAIFRRRSATSSREWNRDPRELSSARACAE